MKRVVEIHRKKGALLWAAAFGLGGAVLSTWSSYDYLLPLSWNTAWGALGILIPALTGLAALAKLLSDKIRHEPYLLVYDDSIEIRHWLTNKFQPLHFCDVEDIVRVDDLYKFEIVFKLQPYLKRSDLPRRPISFKKTSKNTFKLSLTSLSMLDKEVYDLILDRFQRYQEKTKRYDSKLTINN